MRACACGEDPWLARRRIAPGRCSRGPHAPRLLGPGRDTAAAASLTRPQTRPPTSNLQGVYTACVRGVGQGANGSVGWTNYGSLGAYRIGLSVVGESRCRRHHVHPRPVCRAPRLRRCCVPGGARRRLQL